MEWKAIEGYPYFVNRDGQVKSGYTKQLMSTLALNGGGYNYVTLFGPLSKHNFMVHRLVALAFIPNPGCKDQVNHKDGDKRNNCADNLEWTTQFENMKHAVETQLSPRGESSYLAKVTEEDVLNIRVAAADGATAKELSKQYGLNSGAISGILLGKTWKHIGGPLKEREDKARLTPADIPKIRAMFREGRSDSFIGLQFNVARGNIQQIRSGKNWSNY